MKFTPDVLSLYLLATYLVGALPFGVLVGRARGVDPRRVGSGNIGMTNVWRALGPKAALLVLALDIAKGYLPIFLARILVSPVQTEQGRAWYAICLVLIGIMAIAGHNWPVFLGFKGGKGVSTTVGVMFALDWRAGLVVAATFFLLLAVTRYVSLSSTVASIVLPLSFFFFNRGNPAAEAYTILGILAAVFIVVKHRSNFARIACGTEPKVGQRREPAPSTS